MGKDPSSAEWEFLTEKLLLAGIVLVAAGSLLFFDMPGQGQLWDKLSGAFSTQQEDPVMAEETPSNFSDDGRDRLLVVSAPQQPELTKESAEAAADCTPADYPKLTSRLMGLNDPRRRAMQKTSTSLASEPGPSQPAASAWTPLPTYSLEAPQEQDENEEAARRTVVSGRARAGGREAIMSRSAGPVYNVTSP